MTSAAVRVGLLQIAFTERQRPFHPGHVPIAAELAANLVVDSYLLESEFLMKRCGGRTAVRAEILNLQPRRDGTAKAYQVKQVRAIISRYKLTGES